jgi:hypothetical protein
MRLAHAVRVISAVLLVSGVFALLMPSAAADLAGLQIELGSANGRVEIGAVYGGIPIALGLIGMYATISVSPSAGAMLATVGWIFATVVVARLVVAFFAGIDGLGLTGWLLLGFDIVAAGVFLLGSRALDDVDL